MKRAWYALSLLLILKAVYITMATGTSGRMCTHPDNVSILNHGVRLPNAEFHNMTTAGLMTCADNCLRRSRCLSFNYNMVTRLCEINYISNSSLLVITGDFVYSDVRDWPQRLARNCANYPCRTNEVCDLDPGGFHCRVFMPSSCAEVKLCRPNSVDGEYWIYLVNFDLHRTRIYCHNMNTDAPTEYLTLLEENNSTFPAMQNYMCGGLLPLTGTCVGRNGSMADFYKIRVDPETMIVDSRDFTHANRSGTVQMYYARAFDCYNEHYNDVLSCGGTAGRFTVDLRGTGWVVHPQQEWRTFGWKPIVEAVDREAGGAVVRLKCGGYGGGCEPDGGLHLLPNYSEDLDDSSATEVKCG